MRLILSEDDRLISRRSCYDALRYSVHIGETCTLLSVISRENVQRDADLCALQNARTRTLLASAVNIRPRLCVILAYIQVRRSRTDLMSRGEIATGRMANAGNDNPRAIASHGL